MTEPLDILLQRTGPDLALFLDFDGVLVDIAPSPGAVRVASQLPDTLRRLERRLGGALAIVSGRPLEEIDRFLSCATATVFGSHGAQFRLAGETGVPDPEIREAAESLADAARARLEHEDGVLIEPKPAGVAVHYRNAPNARHAVEQVMVEAVARTPGFSLMAGKMVFEARMDGFDKGTAVDTLMDRPPFAGRVPVFVGDDVTDEDGMRAAIARGGYGIKVGEGESVAQFRLSDPAAVAALLDGLSSAGTARFDA